MNDPQRLTERDKWTDLLRISIQTLVLASIISAFILLLLFSFSRYIGPVTDGTLLVSVLGILVTALITWQIFNAVENSKTLRKMGNLEDRLNGQIALSEMKTQAMFDFAEAHRLEQEANRTTDIAHEYGCHARALLRYLKSDIDLSYPPLQGKTSVLSMIITKVEHSKNEDDKILFARQLRDFDSINDDILDEIGKRAKELRKLRKDIINLQVRRNNIFSPHIGKETSTELALRKSQEDKKRKEADAKAAKDSNQPSTDNNKPEPTEAQEPHGAGSDSDAQPSQSNRANKVRKPKIRHKKRNN